MGALPILLLVIPALLGGLVGFFVARRVLVRIREILMPVDNSSEIIEKARRRKDAALQAASRATREHLESEAARYEEERAIVVRIQENFEQELNRRQSEIDLKANALAVRETENEQQMAAVHALQTQIGELESARAAVNEDFLRELESRSGCQRSELLGELAREMLTSERLKISKWLMEHMEEQKLEAERMAREVLWTVVSRYGSKIVWPKPSSALEVARKDLSEKFFGPGSALIAALVEGLGISVDLDLGEEGKPATFRISGGSGAEREILRNTIDEAINRQVFALDGVLKIRDKHRAQTESLIARLGDEAVRNLRLKGMDSELRKLIGSLMYRTSHRQNQYFHSLEVATLAGMLAHEIGVEAEPVKRSGLLHDIGKALDYRLEGSHAVISGTYAEKFGEPSDVVDTVWAHHDDRIVETPAAFILKAADAMSGARPGARAEMEEGFQKRIEAIETVIRSFEKRGVVNSAIMHAGREIHVFVDNRHVSEQDAGELARQIAGRLESDVEYPGQIRVTVVRRTEVTEVA